METDTENRTIRGYGVVFNSDSLPLTVYDSTHGHVRVVEQITRESMRDADMSDVMGAYNHNFEKILGRTTSGTMTIDVDDAGVRYTIRAGKQSYATDLLESLRRGDVVGSSFTFTYDFDEGYEFEDRDDGTLVAVPKKITKIYEMGPVTNPAYPETSAENRTDALVKAVKRHLEQREKLKTEAEQDADGPDVDETEVLGPDDVEGRENEPETAETRNFYPRNYYQLKAKAKRRV